MLEARREAVHDRIESIWTLVLEDRVVRYAAFAAAGLVWLSVAWLTPVPFLLALAAVGGVGWYRRRNPAEPDADDEWF
jgi:hypothetical protein